MIDMYENLVEGVACLLGFIGFFIGFLITPFATLFVMFFNFPKIDLNKLDKMNWFGVTK